ncbi:MAG: GAF domain-containing protein, partial [Myxococcaceae bacterium]
DELLRLEHLDGRPLRPGQEPATLALSGRAVHGFSTRGRYPDGRELTLEISASPIAGAGGAVSGAVLVIRDVSDLERARIESVVSRVATAAARVRTRAELVELVLPTAAEALGAIWIGLYRADFARWHLELVGQHGPPEYREITSTLPLEETSLSAQAVLSGRMQRLEDTSRVNPTYTATVDILRTMKAGAVVSVPLLTRGKAVGALTYTTLEPRHFSERELEALRVIGDIVSVAVENARLYEETEQKSRQLGAVIDASPEAIVFYEASTGRVSMQNRATERILGKSVELRAAVKREPERCGPFYPDGRRIPPRSGRPPGRFAASWSPGWTW